MTPTTEQESAIRYVLDSEGHITRGRLQRMFKIGWHAATEMMDAMVAKGIVRPLDTEAKTIVFQPVYPTTDSAARQLAKPTTEKEQAMTGLQPT